MDDHTWSVAFLGWFLDHDEVSLQAMLDYIEEVFNSEARQMMEDSFRILSRDPKHIARLSPKLWELAGRPRQ